MKDLVIQFSCSNKYYDLVNKLNENKARFTTDRENYIIRIVGVSDIHFVSNLHFYQT